VQKGFDKKVPTNFCTQERFRACSGGVTSNFKRSLVAIQPNESTGVHLAKALGKATLSKQLMCAVSKGIVQRELELDTEELVINTDAQVVCKAHSAVGFRISKRVLFVASVQAILAHAIQSELGCSIVRGGVIDSEESNRNSVSEGAVKVLSIELMQASSRQ
jgi:hypothetical protein